jgi:hypothetical protein
MTLVTVTGTLLASNDLPPDAGGIIQFFLDGSMVTPEKKVIEPKVIKADLSAVNGTFSVDLEATENATPDNRRYAITLSASFDGQQQSLYFGNYRLPATDPIDLSAILAQLD